MAGRFNKVVVVIDAHPVAKGLSLLGSAVFVYGLVHAIVTALTHLGLASELYIAVPLALLVMILLWAYFQSVKPPPPVAAASEPASTPAAKPPAVTPPPRPALVVDDLSAWVGWQEDRDGGIAIEAACRIHITNHTGQSLRLLKARLNKAATTGTVEITGGNWDFSGVSVLNGQYESLTCKFKDLPKNVLDDSSFTDFLMITSGMTQSYGVNVTFKKVRSKYDDLEFPEDL